MFSKHSFGTAQNMQMLLIVVTDPACACLLENLTHANVSYRAQMLLLQRNIQPCLYINTFQTQFAAWQGLAQRPSAVGVISRSGVRGVMLGLMASLASMS